ncbi:hypothetical protein SRHO_G00025550 [Serrasalmus rhombeus]
MWTSAAYLKNLVAADRKTNQEQQTLEVRRRLDSQGLPSDDRGRHSHVSALDISGRRSPGRHCAALKDGGSDNSERRGSVLEARGRGSLDSHDWKLEPDLKLISREREREMLTFYKRHICWARPFSVILRGDVLALQAKVELLTKEVSALDAKWDDLESRSRRQSIRIVGVPEGETFSLTSSAVSELLRQAFDLDKLLHCKP